MAQKLQDSFYDGWLYHLFVDPVLRRVHRLVRSQVKSGSTLIDIGCGTGELLFSLADVGSELVGVETSKRMWSFADRQARRLVLLIMLLPAWSFTKWRKASVFQY
jgi:2-polyprenyl-3-methyl-5-hydroxy-6-metoxy-1,4-benzoquinol methylase